MCLVSSIVEHSTDNRKTEERYLYQIPICSCRLLARTLPFQGGEDGSKPFGSTILKSIKLVFFNMVNVRVTRKAREQTATLFYAGSTPVAYSNDFRLVHIMVIIADCLSVDGSSILPRVASFFALVSLVVEVLFCKQGVEVRFLPGAPS
jgi:hypothetical protein